MSNFQLVKLLDSPIHVNMVITPRGIWLTTEIYSIGDLVSYNGLSYIAIAPSINIFPTNTSYWQVVIDIKLSLVISNYAEITSVASSITTSILTYTVPPATTASLHNVDVSGTNIATYEVLLNTVVIDKKRTYFGGALNEVFNFNKCVDLIAGDTLLIRVTHSRPSLGDFNARIALFTQI